MPHGVENRFSPPGSTGSSAICGAFVEAAQWQQFRALKYQIESMRRQAGARRLRDHRVHDCHWESNGLLDMRRNPRVFHELFHIVNADTVIVPKWERASYWAGETVALELSVAHGAGSRLEDCQLEISVGSETERLPLPRIAAPDVLNLGRVEISLPEVDEPALRRINFDLRTPDGKLVAHNHLDIAIHPKRAKPVHARELVWSPDEDIRDRFRTLGYNIARAFEESTLIVSRTHNKAIADHVRAGAKLLLLPEEDMTLYPFFPHWQAVRVQAAPAPSGPATGPRPSPGCAARAISPASRPVRCSTRPWTGCCRTT